MTGVKNKKDADLRIYFKKIIWNWRVIPLSKLFPRKLLLLLLKEKNKLGLYLPNKYLIDLKKIYNDKELNLEKTEDNILLSKFFTDNDYILKYLNIDEIVKDLLIEYNNEDIMTYSHSIEDIKKVKITDINIVNIVSDFNTNFKIKREILYELIRTKYNIISRFDPCIYPGVKINFIIIINI